MANWKEYTTKTTPEDADEIMIADSKANVSKRTPFSGLWNWIAGKLATAVISQLETQNKSIIPALNELNSNFCTGIINNSICDCRYIKSGKNVSIWFGSAMMQLEQDKKYEIATLPDLVKTAGNFEIEITGNGRKYKIGINGKGVLTLALLDKNTGVAPFVGASFCYPIIR